MTVRYVTKSDLEQLEELDKKCFPPPVRYNRYALDYYLSLHNTLGLAEILEERVIGFIIVTLTGDSIANIVTIDVDPFYRKHGIGSKLMKIAKNILIDWNVNKITLQVSVDNNIAVNFYQKHGFKIIKKLPMYYPSTDGYQMEHVLG